MKPGYRYNVVKPFIELHLNFQAPAISQDFLTSLIYGMLNIYLTLQLKVRKSQKQFFLASIPSKKTIFISASKMSQIKKMHIIILIRGYLL